MAGPGCEQGPSFGAAGFLGVAAQQGRDFVELFAADGFHHYRLGIAAAFELAVRIERPGFAAGHAGAKIGTDRAEHQDRSGGHVFAAVVAATFNHRSGAGIADRETFAHPAGGVKLASGGPRARSSSLCPGRPRKNADQSDSAGIFGRTVIEKKAKSELAFPA